MKGFFILINSISQELLCLTFFYLYVILIDAEVIMKRLLVIIILLSYLSLFAEPTSIKFPYYTEHEEPLLLPDQADMSYHSDPEWWWTFDVSNYVPACCFDPEGDYGINEGFKILTIGFIGFREDGNCTIYIQKTSSCDELPTVNPDDGWSDADYGPFYGHINATYPNYDDIDVSEENWCFGYGQPFWLMYHIESASPPHPGSDDGNNWSGHSYTWDPTSHEWKDKLGTPPIGIDWCIHCVVFYPTSVENTSIGKIKSLFY